MRRASANPPRRVRATSHSRPQSLFRGIGRVHPTPGSSCGPVEHQASMSTCGTRGDQTTSTSPRGDGSSIVMVIFLKHSVWIVLKHVMSLTEPLCASTVWSALGYHMHAACSISQAAAQLRCTRAHLQGRKCFTRLCSNDIGRNQAKITVLSCIPRQGTVDERHVHRFPGLKCPQRTVGE